MIETEDLLNSLLGALSTKRREDFRDELVQVLKKLSSIEDRITQVEKLVNTGGIFSVEEGRLKDTPEGKEAMKALELFYLNMALLAETMRNTNVKHEESKVATPSETVVLDMDTKTVKGSEAPKPPKAPRAPRKQPSVPASVISGASVKQLRFMVRDFRNHPQYKAVKSTARYKYVEASIAKKDIDAAYVLCEYLSYMERLRGVQVTADMKWKDLRLFIPRLSSYIWPAKDRAGQHKIWNSVNHFLTFYLEWKTKSKSLPRRVFN